jgi:hypothetical protein
MNGNFLPNALRPKFGEIDTQGTRHTNKLSFYHLQLNIRTLQHVVNACGFVILFDHKAVMLRCKYCIIIITMLLKLF